MLQLFQQLAEAVENTFSSDSRFGTALAESYFQHKLQKIVNLIKFYEADVLFRVCHLYWRIDDVFGGMRDLTP